MNTIVACATGLDPSALAVIRLGGSEALDIARALCGAQTLTKDR